VYIAARPDEGHQQHILGVPATGLALGLSGLLVLVDVQAAAPMLLLLGRDVVTLADAKLVAHHPGHIEPRAPRLPHAPEGRDRNAGGGRPAVLGRAALQDADQHHVEPHALLDGVSDLFQHVVQGSIRAQRPADLQHHRQLIGPAGEQIPLLHLLVVALLVANGDSSLGREALHEPQRVPIERVLCRALQEDHARQRLRVQYRYHRQDTCIRPKATRARNDQRFLCTQHLRQGSV
jgi:hypothetical protein